MKIISIDPGGTTGIVIMSTELLDNAADDAELEILHVGPKEHHKVILGVLYDERPDVVVCESFPYATAYAELISLEYIGVVKLYCALNDVTLSMQTNSQGMNFWTDDKIKFLDLWDSKRAPHGMDALRHLLYWITYSKGAMTYLMKLKNYRADD